MDLQTIVQNDILGRNLDVRIDVILASLALAFILGCLTTWVYKITHHGVNFTISFTYALIVMPIIICAIMIAIGSSISLSLGLVGSLSIMRFRTAIRDVRDMVYIFSTVAVGLSCGAGNFILAPIACAFFLSVSLLIFHFKGMTRLSEDFIVTVFTKKNKWLDLPVEKLLSESCQSWKEKSMIVQENGMIECSMSVVLSKGQSINDFIKTMTKWIGEDAEIKAITPDSTVLF